MNTNTRIEAEQAAVRLSAIDGLPWLVVDCGGIFRTQYRVWSERTLNEQEQDWGTSAYCLPPYELMSRANNGRLEQIA